VQSSLTPSRRPLPASPIGNFRRTTNVITDTATTDNRKVSYLLPKRPELADTVEKVARLIDAGAMP
jgi:hypothetical protein